MAYDVLQALAPGAISTSTSLAGLLGIEQEVLSSQLPSVVAPAGSITRIKLVKASAAIANSASRALLWTTDASTGTVALITAAAAVTGTVAGFAILPTGTTGVASGDYFWVAIRGPCLATTAAATAAGVALATHGAVGDIDDTTVTYATVVAYGMALTGGAVVATVRACVA